MISTDDVLNDGPTVAEDATPAPLVDDTLPTGLLSAPVNTRNDGLRTKPAF